MLMFYFIVLLAFFAPGLMIPGLAQIWAADIPLLAVLGWRIFSPPRVSLEYKSYMQSKLLLPLFVFAIWLVIVTIMTIPASENVPAIFAIFSLVGRFRPILFLIFFIPYVSDRKKLFKMFKFLIVLFILQSAVIFCQKFNIAEINYWYTPRFRPIDMDITYIFLTGKRTIGTIGNPNSLGTFMSIFAVLGYSVYAFGMGLRRWIGLSMAFLAFVICVFFAGTRQGMLSVILGCAVVSFAAFFMGKIGRLSFVLILIFILSPVLMFYLAQDAYLLNRFAILTGSEGVTDVSSARYRLGLWPEFFGTYGAWVFIGKGMAGYISSITWDSGWLMLIVAGGFPLMFIYLWWLMRIAYACFKALSYRLNDIELFGFLMVGPATTFIVIIINIVNNTYGSTKIAILVELAYILALGSAYELQYGTYDQMEYEYNPTI